MNTHQILTSEAHRELRIRTERGPACGDDVMSSLVVPDEFRQVQAEYPILFRLNAERDDFVALAMFGFTDGENLFLVDGAWDARHRPLAIDVQPFLIGRTEEGGTSQQVHVDTASPRLGGAEGIRIFDADGRPTPYLEDVAEKLGALDTGWRGSAAFFAALRRNELLEPFTLEITLDDGSTNRLVGYHVIDEARLAALDPAALAELSAEGHLLPIFMAVASLANIGALVDRKNRRLRDGRG